MASFKFYNIQVLPLNPKENGLIGTEGYKKIFRRLAGEVKRAIYKERNFLPISYSLPGEMMFAPTRIAVRKEYSYGEFLKFDQVKIVVDTIDGSSKYEAKGRESSKRYKFRFVFDHVKHIMAIESKQKIPGRTSIINSLEEIIYRNSKEIFPEHYVKIIELTAAESLDEIIKTEHRYSSMSVSITYSNSQDWLDGVSDLVKDIEEEMSENGVDEVEHKEKASKDSSMNSPTKVGLALLGLAPKFGNADITYFKGKSEKKHTYHMSDYPIRLKVSESIRGKVKGTFEFVSEVRSTILQADKAALLASNLLDRIRKEK